MIALDPVEPVAMLVARGGQQVVDAAGVGDQLQDRAAVVRGVPRLEGAPVTAHDLRGGVALVIAALGADGDSVVHDIHHLERGYEDLPDKLRRLGAEVEVEIWSGADQPSYDVH